jgi:predicted ATPase
VIDQLLLQRFKRFARLHIELGALTVLTGLNSGGKSSTLQALLLLRQALTGDGVIALNGPYGLALGEAADVLHRGADDDTIELAARDAASSAWTSVRLRVPEGRALHLVPEPAPDRSAAPSALTAPEPAFTCLGAERHGPRDVLPAESRDASQLGVGVFGQYTAQVLDQHQRLKVPEGRLHPLLPGESPTEAQRFLHRQAERWLSRILGLHAPVRLDARWIEGTTVTTLRFQLPGAPAEWTRPQNIGFGTSSVLPIVVAALQAPRGGLLMVENPEAHLHPLGQSLMGAFLAQVAADGVQVLIETHSDHVVNGIRRAVASGEVALAPGAARISYFHSGPDGAPQHEAIEIAQTGDLSAWPPGFFDQIERDLGALARARRARRGP